MSDGIRIPKNDLPNFEVRTDRGTPDAIDRADEVVRKADGKTVDWQDREFKTARQQWVRRNVLDSSAAKLTELGKTLAPAGAEAPNYAAIKREIDALVKQLEKVVQDPDRTAALESDAHLLIAGLKGQIAKCEPGAGTGKAALTPLRAALEANPNNMTAWASYGVSMANIHVSAPLGAKRSFADTYLFGLWSGRSIEKELRSAIDKLAAAPDDIGAQVALEHIYGTLQGKPNGRAFLTPADQRQIAQVEARIAEWSRTDPERLETIRANYRVTIPEPTDLPAP